MFHIGVHNLPPEEARALEAGMAIVTADPRSERVAEMLAAMHAMKDMLLVLNHPFRSQERVEAAEHVRLLRVFLEEFGAWIHALELNGLQPAASNVDTIHLAAERGLPVISGGDRHCCEPDANVNLTNAGTFAAFVNEIRCEKRSCVLFLPQYRDPIPVDGSGVLYARDRRDRDARVRVAPRRAGSDPRVYRDHRAAGESRNACDVVLDDGTRRKPRSGSAVSGDARRAAITRGWQRISTGAGRTRWRQSH